MIKQRLKEVLQGLKLAVDRYKRRQAMKRSK
jgi:hypothetical protein